jgi:hypothetical protein
VPQVENVPADWFNGTNGLNVYSGLRTVFQTESHDGGSTWSEVQAISGGLTRTGVSCDVDPSNGRVALVFQGFDDAIWTTSRLASASGTSAWTAVTQINTTIMQLGKIPQTREVPEIVFDRFQPSEAGRISWFEDLSLTHWVAHVRFNGSRYVLDTSAPPLERVEVAGGATYEHLRTTPVLSFDQQVIFHLMTSFGNQMTAFSQRYFTSSGFDYMWVYWTVIPAPITWYTGAAQNPSAFQIGTVQRMMLNPN